MQIVTREDATSYSTRDGAQIVANVLAGLETAGRTFKVYEITGRGVFQIMASLGDEIVGWYADDPLSITYTTDTVQRTFLMERGGFSELWVGRVIRTDERGATPIWSSSGYLNQTAAKQQAGKNRRLAEQYFARTGRDWRDDQDAEKAQERTAKAARVAARKQLNGAAPALLAALERLADAALTAGLPRESPAFQAALDAIDAAKGEEG